MIKKILLIVSAIFLAYRSIELITMLEATKPHNFSWYGALLYSFVLNLFVTGIFALVGFAVTTSALLPNSYYAIRQPHYLTKLYRILGVEYFKLLLLKFFWGKEKNRKKYFDGTKAGLENFEFQTKQSEFGHLGAFIAVEIISFFILFKGFVSVFVFTTCINIIGNFYPIVLQRNHRVQLERLKVIIAKKEQKRNV